MGGTYQESDKPALGLREDVENRVHQAAELTQRFNDRLALGVANLAERHRRGEVEVTFSSASSQISGWSGQNIFPGGRINSLRTRPDRHQIRSYERRRRWQSICGVCSYCSANGWRKGGRSLLGKV